MMKLNRKLRFYANKNREKFRGKQLYNAAVHFSATVKTKILESVILTTSVFLLQSNRHFTCATTSSTEPPFRYTRSYIHAYITSNPLVNIFQHQAIQAYTCAFPLDLTASGFSCSKANTQGKMNSKSWSGIRIHCYADNVARSPVHFTRQCAMLLLLVSSSILLLSPPRLLLFHGIRPASYNCTFLVPG